MAHKDSCVGMEANMIGVRKRIIVLIMKEHIWLSSIPRLSKNQDRMMQKKVVFLCSEAPANANAIQTIKAQRKIAEFKTLTKSFFGWTVQIIRMKSTIAMVF